MPNIETLLQRAEANNPLFKFEGVSGETGTATITCRECGYQEEGLLANFQFPISCRNCGRKIGTSFMECFIYFSFVEALGVEKVQHKIRGVIGNSLELDIYIPSLNLAFEPGSWYFHRERLDYDKLKRELSAEMGIRMVILYDAYPRDEAAPFESDCLVYPINLGQENGVGTLKEATAKLFQIAGLLAPADDFPWTRIIYQAQAWSTVMSREEFVSRVGEVSPEIEILEYVNSSTPAKCRCSKHGYEWEVSPDNLLNGLGKCFLCNIDEGRRAIVTNQREFDLKFQSQYGDTGIEVLTPFAGANEPITLSCPKHPEPYIWETTPHQLLRPSTKGCPQCGRESGYASNRMTDEEFLSILGEVNPDIEPLEPYKTTMTPIHVRCRVCGHEWHPTPNSLTIKGTGCPKCGNAKIAEARATNPEDFEERMKRVRPDITCLEKYTRNHAKMEVQGTCGHRWTTTPHHLLAGVGCPECAKTSRAEQHRLDQAEFEAKVAEVNPDLEITSTYEHNAKKVSYRCRRCGREGTVAAISLIQGRGHDCSKKGKKVELDPETIIREYTEEQMTIAAIADRHGVRNGRVRTLLVKHGIELRPSGLHCDIPEDKLRRLYLEEAKTLKEISEELGCSIPTLNKEIKKLGLSRPSMKKKH